MSGDYHNDISSWLASLGLSEYDEVFADNDIDASIVVELTQDDLREIGVTSVGHRRKLLIAAAQLGAGADEDTHDSAAPVAERRVLTVLFGDLMDSTALSGSADPEEYVEFINLFRRELDTAIEGLGGHIAQYLGDGVMASFGYPTASGFDAERAVAAALAVIERVDHMPPLGNHRAQVRIGIATGLTIVGAQDTSLSVHDDSAIGPIPNLAARMQGVARANTVVVSTQTRELAGQIFDYFDRGVHELKGVAEPVRVWEVTGRSSTASRYDALRNERSSANFVGRSKELERLTDEINSSRAQHGRVVVIAGAAGVGKSRLALEALSAAIPESAPHFTLQCSPYGVGVAFDPIAYVISQASGAGVHGEPDDAVAKLASYLGAPDQVTNSQVALVAELVGSPATDHRLLEEMSSAEKRYALKSTLAGVLATEAQRTGVLVIEDAQWMDPSTAELMSDLIADVQQRRVLVLATLRPGSAPEWTKAADVNTVQLEGLRSTDVSDLVQSVAGAFVLPPDVLATITERSDGVPIFAEELTRGYIASRTGSAGAAATVPLSLSESILGRLDRLAYGRRIASIAAAIGPEFPVDVLRSVSDLPESSVDVGVRELFEADVFERGQSQFGEAIKFRHNLVRDAAYELLLRRQLQPLHSRIAAALQDEFPNIGRSVPHVLAIHLDLAERPAEATTQWRRAGQMAWDRSAYTEAAGYFLHAIESNNNLEDSPDRDKAELDLRMSRVSALICGRGYEAATVSSETDRIVELGELVGGSEALMMALQAEWGQLGISNQIAACLDFSERVLATTTSGPTIERLVALRMCHTDLLDAGVFDRSIALGREFVDFYDEELHGEHLRSGHSEYLTMVMLGLAEAHTLMGATEEADTWRRRALRRARETQRHHDQGHTLVYGGCLGPYMMERYDAVAENAALLAELMDVHELPNWLGFLGLFNGVVAIQRGNVEDGIVAAKGGYELLQSSKAFGNWWHIVYADAAVIAGQWDDAEAALGRARAIWEDGTCAFAAELLRIDAALSQARDGDTTRALALLDEATALASEQGAQLLLDRVARDREQLSP